MRVRRLSITSKLTILISFLSVLCVIGVGTLTYVRESNNLISRTKENGMALAACAAGEINGDSFNVIAEGMEESEEYRTVYDSLSVFRDNGNVEYVYSMKKMENGTVVFVVDTDTEEPAGIFEEYETMDSIEKAFSGQISVDEEITTDEWGSFFSAYSPIFDSNHQVVGIVGIDISADWIDAQLMSEKLMLILIGGIFTVIGILLSYIISSRIGKNLKKLNQKISDLASGDGDLTQFVEMKSGDELEVIASSVNRFIINIRELVCGVNNTAEDSLVLGNKLNDVVEVNADKLNGINESISTLSANMEECTASSISIIEELDRAVEQVDGLTTRTIDVMKSTDGVASEAETIIEEAKKSKNYATEKIDVIQAKIEEASENAKKIEFIQSMAAKIEKIAQQTNILSLNAKIEAGRAGEHGKSFAVVAGNVGKLSEEIENTVKEMNLASTEVMEAVKSLLDETTQINHFMNQDVMKDYDKMVKIGEQYGNSALTINDQMKSLGEETGIINETIAQVKENIHEIGRAVSDTTVQAVEVNSLSEDIVQGMHNINALTEENKVKADELKDEISKFKF